MTEKVKFAEIKPGVFLFFPLRMTWRWTVGIGPDDLCRLGISMASQCATVKVRENGWTPPLIRGTLGGIRANTRTRTSVISSFLSAPLILLCRFLFSQILSAVLFFSRHYWGWGLYKDTLHPPSHTHYLFQVYSIRMACAVCSSLSMCKLMSVCVFGCGCECVRMPKQLTAAG